MHLTLSPFVLNVLVYVFTVSVVLVKCTGTYNREQREIVTEDIRPRRIPET